jgi:hypothetical protein
MTRYLSTASYQGIDAIKCSVDRKPGLTSDAAWVEMLIDNLAKIDLKPQFRPWADINRKEFPGPAHMGGVLKALRGAGASQATPSGGGGAKAGELKRGGPLVMTTTPIGATPGGPSGGRTVTLKPMFVSPSGIREVEEDLAFARLHDEGTIRIGLVDIRYWWDKYGTPVWGDYNIANEYGVFDKDYLDKGTGKPYTLHNFFEYLCACLPGAPLVSTASVTKTGKFNPPQNVKMRFELPSYWLHRLLEDYGLELHLTRESNVYIGLRGAHHTVRSFTQFAGGNEFSIPDEAEYEKKTIYTVDVPEGVFVAGGRRMRRMVSSCLPCFVDEDGQIRALDDLPKLWGGYTVKQARQQALLSGEKAYIDVPGKDGRQKHARVQIARRYFWRMYAPAWMFEDDPTRKGVLRYWDVKAKKSPFLPMKDPVFTPEELKTMPEVVATASGLPDSAAVLKKLEAPVVRASVIRQDYSDNLDDFRSKMSDAIKALEEKKAAIQKQKAALFQELSEIEDGKPDFEGPSLLGLDDPVKFRKFREFVNDLTGRFIAPIEDALQEDADWNARALTIKGRIEAMTKRWEKETNEYNDKINENKKKFLEAVKAVEALSFARMWVNAPYGIAKDASVNRETGVITFSDLAAVMDAPAVRDIETAKLVGDGDVEVTFMYEADRNRPNDYSYWCFMAPEKEGEPVSLVEVDEPTGLKPTIYKDESLVIYETETGSSLNLNEISQKAARAAGGILKLGRQQDGYEYKYPGFWQIATDDAQNEVVWLFDGDTASTVILANHPDGSVAGWASLKQKREKESLIYPYQYPPEATT